MKLLTLSLALAAAATLTGCHEDVYVQHSSRPGYYGGYDGYDRHRSTTVVVDGRSSYDRSYDHRSYDRRPYGYGYRAPVRHDTVVVAGRSNYRPHNTNTVVVNRRTTPASNVVVVDKRKKHHDHDHD
jgi:hypothetical protein